MLFNWTKWVNLSVWSHMQVKANCSCHRVATEDQTDGATVVLRDCWDSQGWAPSNREHKKEMQELAMNQ